jgi:hypothetical protein
MTSVTIDGKGTAPNSSWDIRIYFRLVTTYIESFSFDVDDADEYPRVYIQKN